MLKKILKKSRGGETKVSKYQMKMKRYFPQKIRSCESSLKKWWDLSQYKTDWGRHLPSIFPLHTNTNTMWKCTITKKRKNHILGGKWTSNTCK